MTAAEVRNVFSNGINKKSNPFYSKFTKSESFKAAVSCPAKVFKKAVLRNKIKRKIYSILSSLQIFPPVHIVFIPNPSILKETHAKITQEIKSTITSLK